MDNLTQAYGHVSDTMLEAGGESMQQFINEWKARQQSTSWNGTFEAGCGQI